MPFFQRGDIFISVRRSDPGFTPDLDFSFAGSVQLWVVGVGGALSAGQRPGWSPQRVLNVQNYLELFKKLTHPTTTALHDIDQKIEVCI